MTFTVVINVFDVVISFYTNHHDCSPSLVRHITVQSSASFTVRIGWPIQLSKTSSCLFLLSFMLTLPLHEVMIPLFFAFCFLFLNFFFHKWILPFSLFFLLHFIPPTFFPFLFSWFVSFLTTASWNRSGWHPRSLTGQCTSHIPPLLYFSDSCPYSCFSSYILSFVSGFSLTLHVVSLLPLCVCSLPHTLFHPSIYLCSPI